MGHPLFEQIYRDEVHKRKIDSACRQHLAGDRFEGEQVIDRLGFQPRSSAFSQIMWPWLTALLNCLPNSNQLSREAISHVHRGQVLNFLTRTDVPDSPTEKSFAVCHAQLKHHVATIWKLAIADMPHLTSIDHRERRTVRKVVTAFADLMEEVDKVTKALNDSEDRSLSSAGLQANPEQLENFIYGLHHHARKCARLAGQLGSKEDTRLITESEPDAAYAARKAHLKATAKSEAFVATKRRCADLVSPPPSASTAQLATAAPPHEATTCTQQPLHGTEALNPNTAPKLQSTKVCKNTTGCLNSSQCVFFGDNVIYVK